MVSGQVSIGKKLKNQDKDDNFIVLLISIRIQDSLQEMDQDTCENVHQRSMDIIIPCQSSVGRQATLMKRRFLN